MASPEAVGVVLLEPLILVVEKQIPISSIDQENQISDQVFVGNC